MHVAVTPTRIGILTCDSDFVATESNTESVSARIADHWTAILNITLSGNGFYPVSLALAKSTDEHLLDFARQICASWRSWWRWPNCSLWLLTEFQLVTISGPWLWLSTRLVVPANTAAIKARLTIDTMLVIPQTSINLCGVDCCRSLAI